MRRQEGPGCEMDDIAGTAISNPTTAQQQIAKESDQAKGAAPAPAQVRYLSGYELVLISLSTVTITFLALLDSSIMSTVRLSTRSVDL